MDYAAQSSVRFQKTRIFDSAAAFTKKLVSCWPLLREEQREGGKRDDLCDGDRVRVSAVIVAYEEISVQGRRFVLVHAGLEHFSPTRLLFKRIGKPELPDRIFHRSTMIGVDCGCAYPGGRLGCLCLDTMEEFYV